VASDSAGMLFARSPRPVASGVTRGEKKEETRVRMLHVSDPREVCGGVIGLPENKKFCAAHTSVCGCQASHRGKKANPHPDTLHVMAPKKGATHANLRPALKGSHIPSDVILADLLEEERPVAMWHVCFDGCNVSEEATGENELQGTGYDSWDHLQRLSLDELERANDFKTPKKVRLLLDLDIEVKDEPFRLDPLESLDLTRLPPNKDMTPSHTTKWNDTDRPCDLCHLSVSFSFSVRMFAREIATIHV
jgi:hypothetical protein